MKTDCSVVLTRYNEPNDLILPCLENLALQKNISLKVLFLDQKRDDFMKNYLRKLSNKRINFIYKNIPAKSLSYARNVGINLVKENIVLFIDSDAIPNHDWAYNLFKSFEINDVAISGGKSKPLWLKSPSWYHKSNMVSDVYSLIDLGDRDMKTPRIVGVNFGIKKSLLKKEAFFDESLGRRPGSLLGGEESDLCKRAIKRKLSVYYVHSAMVKHQIQKDRMSIMWLIRRFYYGGIGKALTGGMPKTYTNKKTIEDFFILPIIIIPYLIGYVRGKII